MPRRPPNQTGSIRITAPPEAVWELMTTVDTVSEWYDTWNTVENDTTDPGLRVGSSFHLTVPTRLRWEQSAPTSQYEIAPHYGSDNFTETNDIATVSVNLALAQAASDNKTETGQEH